MKIRLAFTSSLAVFLLGCAHTPENDTSPLPAQDPQTKVDQASKNVQGSNMTPEQKQAAIDYLSKGASNAEHIKQSAQNATAGASK